MIKKLFGQSVLFALGSHISKVVNIAMLPLITAFLTPMDYGVYGVVLAYMGLLSGFKTLGVGVLLVNSFYKKRDWKPYWKRYLGILIVNGLLFFLVAITFLFYFLPSEVTKNRILIILLITIPVVLFDNTIMLGSRLLQLRQDAKRVAIFSIVAGLVAIIVNYITIVIFKLGFIGWFISSAVSSFLSFLFYFKILYFKEKILPVFQIRLKFLKKSFKVSLPTIPHNYSSYLLNSSDRIVMEQLNVNIDKLGLYNLAYIFGGYIDIVGNAVGLAVGPYYNKLYAQKEMKYEYQARELTFFLQITFIVACALVSLWVRELFSVLIANESLQKAYSLSIIIIMGYSYRPLYWASGIKLMFNEKTNKLWRISFSAGVLNITLNFIFIPIYGVFAAAITTLFSLLTMALTPFMLKEYKSLSRIKLYPFLWVSLIILLTFFLFQLKDTAPSVKLIISIFLLLCYFFYVRYNWSKLNEIQYQTK